MSGLEFFTDQELIAEIERRGYLVAPRKPLGRRAKCTCGECRRCKVREAVRRYRMRRGVMKKEIALEKPKGADPVVAQGDETQEGMVQAVPVSKCHYCEKEPSVVCANCGTAVCVWHAFGSPQGMVCIACFG